VCNKALVRQRGFIDSSGMGIDALRDSEGSLGMVELNSQPSPGVSVFDETWAKILN
jgi:hypothetical protein